LKKLVELGFLDHQRSASMRVGPHSLTAQARKSAGIVDALYQKHVKTVEQVGGISNEDRDLEQVPASPRAVLDRPDPVSALKLSTAT